MSFRHTIFGEIGQSVDTHGIIKSRDNIEIKGINMKKIIVILMLVFVVMSLTGCLPGDKIMGDEPDGFFSGVIHGWLAPLSLIISWFKDDVRMYEVVNSGFWYDFGFYISIIGGFGTITFTRGRKKDN